MKYVGVSSPAWVISSPLPENEKIKKLKELSHQRGRPHPHLSFETMKRAGKLLYPTIPERSFPKAEKDPLIDRKSRSPGPADYFRGPKGSRKASGSEDVPVLSTSSFISGTKRLVIHEFDEMMPSPDYYKPSEEYIYPTSPKIGFGYKADPPTPPKSPSPGSYSPKIPWKKDFLAKFLKEERDINKKPKNNSTEAKIGPGTYSPLISSTEPSTSVKIGTSVRKSPFEVKDKDIPSPANYSPKNDMASMLFFRSRKKRKKDEKDSQSNSHSKEKKADFGKRNDLGHGTPGVGTYFPEIDFKPNSPSLSIGHASQGAYIEIKDTPGPGAYDVIALPKRTYMTLGSSDRTTFKYFPANPGPGTYDHIFSGQSKRKMSQALPSLLNLEEENKKTEFVYPGPGQYEIHSPIGSQKPKRKNKGFTLSERPPAIVGQKDGPGPSSYFIKEEIVESGTKFPKSPKFGPGGILRTKGIADEIIFNKYDIRPTIPQPQPFQKALYEKIKEALRNPIKGKKRKKKKDEEENPES